MAAVREGRVVTEGKGDLLHQGWIQLVPRGSREVYQNRGGQSNSTEEESEKYTRRLEDSGVM